GVDSKYVVNNGIVYWLNWNNRAVISPYCIIQLSIFTNQFGYILILLEARATIQRLLICGVLLYSLIALAAYFSLRFQAQAAPAGPLINHLSSLLKWTKSSASKTPNSDG
ncbi:hypothetical protein S83_047963, partial [Arachis hypogaea]